MYSRLGSKSFGFYQRRIKSLSYKVKSEDGTCKQGERADLTGCTPANGEGKLTGGAMPNPPEKVESTKKPKEKAENNKPIEKPPGYYKYGKLSIAGSDSKASLPKPNEDWQNKAVKAAKELLAYDNRRPDLANKTFVMRLVSVADITPSQSGEAYINESSEYLAKEMERVRKHGSSKIEREEDFWPIVIDGSGKIIDGNHRHAASTINKYPYIWAMIPRRVH